MSMIWITQDGFQILDVPTGKAVLTTWANPSYVHGVILYADGPIETVPNTDWFASQPHMEKMPGLPRPNRGRRFESAFKAAMAYVEWKLKVHEPKPEAAPEPGGLDLDADRADLGLVRASKPCRKCKGTGVIETGNNDGPCDCEAGQKALFNVVGEPGPVSGADLIRHGLRIAPREPPRGEAARDHNRTPGQGALTERGVCPHTDTYAPLLRWLDSSDHWGDDLYFYLQQRLEGRRPNIMPEPEHKDLWDRFQGLPVATRDWIVNSYVARP